MTAVWCYRACPGYPNRRSRIQSETSSLAGPPLATRQKHIRVPRGLWSQGDAQSAEKPLWTGELVVQPD
jgi:hypothetical protein